MSSDCVFVLRSWIHSMLFKQASQNCRVVSEKEGRKEERKERKKERKKTHNPFAIKWEDYIVLAQ